MLTTQQLQTLKAFITADPVLNAFPNNSDGNFEIAVRLNLPATPAFVVWKTSVNVTDIMQNGFDWTRVDNLTVGKARIWEFMTSAGVLNPSLANVRAGFEACFSVEVADGPTRQAIYNHCLQNATVLQKLFATGAGTNPTNHGIGPATMAVSGPVSHSEVEQARSL